MPFETSIQRAGPLARFALGFAGLGPQALALHNRELEAEQKRQKATRDAALKSVTETVKGFADAIAKAESPDQVQRLMNAFGRVKPLVEENAQFAGSNPALLMSPLSSALAAFRTAQEKGKAEGQKESAKLQSRLGREPTAAERAQGAGVSGAPEFRNAQLPDGTIRVVDANDRAAVAALPSGTKLFSIAVQPTSVAGLESPGKKEVEKARETITRSSGNISDLGNLLKQIEKAQGSTGIRGTIAEVGAGLLTQFAGKETGEAFSQFVAGASQEEVSRIRTSARLMVSRMLSTITAEESGRYTDTEREIAKQALGALRPEAGFEQISAALKVAMQADVFARERAKVRAAGLSASPFGDAGNERKIIEAARKFVAMGFTKEEAAEMATRLVVELAELAGQFGGNK